MPARPGLLLPRLFWITAACCALVLIVPAMDAWAHPHGEFSGLVMLVLAMLVVVEGLVCTVVAAVRKPVAYGIGLVLVGVPVVCWVVISLGDTVRARGAQTVPDAESGRGYFTAPADKALAEAIVAGDIGRVAALAPAANLEAEGWDNMRFMRLALERTSANPEIIGALLRAGIDPDQAGGMLYDQIYRGKNMMLLQQVVDAGVDLNRHMGRGQWFLFVRYDWPEGLALMLDHGANTEVTDGMGYTEIMRAARDGGWPIVSVLLAHGARTDHVGHDGHTLRDLMNAGLAGTGWEAPPDILALQARLP